jgi:hypothetical protein
VEEALFVIGEPPEVYLEMLGNSDEVDLFFRMPEAEEEWKEECFLRIYGLPDEEQAWVH